MVTLREFRRMVAEALDRLPPELLEGLDGGVLVLEEARRHGDALPDVYILGEYVDDPHGLGRYVVLYYGSFRAILGDADVKALRHEIEETIRHELRHHLESLAGVDDLDEEDWRELQAWRAEARLRRLGLRRGEGAPRRLRWPGRDPT
ncbi:MAG: metallopeptidase family protein [Firmicutes bacterium]|uniref:Metallopeptidase family protein n=1 Tax=Geochorda subterranea TaxID=3109564 RepID=A0ABZ1BR93_9FIRM|nr:metallopeptidase family protein [Limnochorda sp. LNt]NLG68590.1 metallopeptidase family protein [Bacillota bacterium]WRP15093.1 metallopeptidase family protein [Limnochorda sp. LNt]